MIGVVGYGKGNLLSVTNALDIVGAPYSVMTDPADIKKHEKILLPGVGAFGDCMSRLKESGFAEAIVKDVRERNTPLLGICVGMQMLASAGEEFGHHEGLGLIEGTVVKIPRNDPNLRLPQVGWNALEFKKPCPLFADMGDDRTCYFVHSFHFKPAKDENISAVVDYGGPVVAAVSMPPIFGVQFHPEKSQNVGLKLLDNFAKL